MTAVSILLLILEVVLGAALLLLIGILFVPVRFKGRADGALHPDEAENWAGTVRWDAYLRWGGGLVQLALSGANLTAAEMALTLCGVRLRRRRSPSKPEPKPAPRAKKRRKARQRPTLDDIRSYIREGLRLAQRLYTAAGLVIEGDIRFGFDDPAATGMTLGALALIGKPAGLLLAPDWQQSGAEGWIRLRGRVFGIQVAAALWSAYWRSPPGRRLRAKFRLTGSKRVQEVEQHGHAG